MKHRGLVQQVGILTILVVILLYLLGLFNPIEARIRDLQQQHVSRDSVPMTAEIVHVDIDDGALQRIGRWPWSRTLLAGCIEEIRRAGARTIAIDLDLTEAGQNSADDAALAAAIKSDTILGLLHQDDELQQRWLDAGGTRTGLDLAISLLEEDIDLDPTTASTLQSQDRAAFTANELAMKRAVLWSNPDIEADGIAEQALQAAYRRQARSEEIAIERSLLGVDRSDGSAMDRLPLPELVARTGGLGYVHISSRDTDGQVRSVAPVQSGRSGAAMSLGAAAAIHYLDGDTSHLGGGLPMLDGNYPIAWPYTEHGTGWMHLLRQDANDPIGTGHLSIGTIADLVRGRGLQQQNRETMSALSLELLRVLRQDASLDVPDPLSIDVQAEIADEYEFTLGELDVDTDLPGVFADEDSLAHARALVNWKNLADAIATSDVEITELEVALAALVGDRLVFLGWSATGSIADFVPTVAGARTPGVVVHAATANMLLTGHTYGYATGWSIILTVLMGIAVVLLVSTTTPWVGTASSLLLVAVYLLIASIMLFAWWNLFIPIAAPTACGLGSWIACTSTSAILIQRDKSRITRQFKARVSDRLVDTLIEQPSALSMNGVRREITVLFADLAGFTTISERLDSAEAVALANRSLSALAGHIVEQDGYVNKFLGDGLMAFWSAFEVQPDQAARACVAAAACAKAIRELPDTDLNVRLGIATGEAIVGDCGAPPELNDYTAIGDTVNIASRIEGANKAFATNVLIDEETKRQAGDAIRTLPIGPVIVVGRSTPTMLHTLADGSFTDESIAAAVAFQSAVSAGDRTAAAAALERMGEFRELDGLCMHWAEAIDGDGELALTLHSK